VSNVEQLLISSVLREGDINLAMANHIGNEMFRAYPDEWEWLEGYYGRYRKTPSKTAFKSEFPKFVVKSVNDTEYFATEVRKAAARRQMLVGINEWTDLIAKGDIDSAVRAMGSSAVKIAASLGTMNDGDIFSMYDDIVSDVERRVDRVASTGSAGIPTGFETLDDKTGGPQPGDLWIVGARLGEGKSWTMQRMATAAVLNGYTVQFDALEQSRAQVGMRIHAFLSSSIGKEIFSTTALMQGRDFDLTRYKKFVRQLKKELDGKLHVSDTTRGRVGLMTVASQIERNRPDIVFIDYLTLMDKKGGEWQDVAALSSGLLNLAVEYQVPIVAASQLNRNASGGKDPGGPETISQSDAIGQDASGIITIKQTSSKTQTMKMAKNRNGPGGFRWHVHFEPDKGILREVDYQTMLDLRDAARMEDSGEDN